jgi:hypothetical protein
MTQVCPNCQHPNRAEAKFCAHCRAPLSSATPTVPAPVVAAPPPPSATSMPSADAMLCPHCGKSLNVKAKFCNYCGQPLTATATPASQVAAPQPVPLAAPTAASQAMSNASAPQSPPPYTPPAFTPKKGPRFQRKQKIVLGVTSAIILVVLITVVALVAPSISPQPPTPTVTPVATSPATVTPTPQPVATETRLPTATALPSPTPDSKYKLITVMPKEGLDSVIFRACPDLKLGDLPAYKLRVRTANPELSSDPSPQINPGQTLHMPSCP